jgi:DNA polymerase (family 10)
MDKWTVARTLSEIANYIELSEPNPFRVRAFQRAARKIETLDADLEKLVASGELSTVPGIGKAIGSIVSEIVITGRSRYLEDLRKQYPAGIFDLLRVPALGLKKIGMLHSQLGIGDLESLEKAAREGRIAKLKGFGAKMQQKILEGIATAESRTSQFLLPVGIAIGESLREQLATIGAVEDAEVTGSVRRRLEIVRNVNIAIAARDPAKAIAAIKKRKVIDRIEEVDDNTIRGVAREDAEVLLHVVKPSHFGTCVFVTTGSKAFVSAVPALPPARTEHELFEKIGIPFIDPELREDPAVFKHKRRVKLIEPTDLRGTFHIHTTYSDGRHSILQMLNAAKESGFEYAGLSDHSQAAFYAHGLTPDELNRQHAEIDKARPEVAPLRVFRGTEADILNDGAIDYGAKILSKFDFVIASIHSRFGMDKSEMTERILRALDNPFVTFLGHATGRMLLSREGYTFDFDRVFDRAAARGVMIEINGNPNRLDLDWRHIGRAIDRGVVFSIHPDAHSIKEMSAVISGTWVARKAGLSAKQIFNTHPVEQVADYLAARRKSALQKSLC